MKRFLDCLAIFGLFGFGCFILSIVMLFTYAILMEPIVRGLIGLIAGYLTGMGFFIWSVDRFYPFLPWSENVHRESRPTR